MNDERSVPPPAPTYAQKSMDVGSLKIGRRTDLGVLAEAKESVDRALDDLALAVLEAQERERARLADELHDGPAQALSNLIMQSEVIERQLRTDPAEALIELRRLRELLRSELDTLRGYIYQLRPPMSESSDLDVALADAAARLTESSGVPVEVRLEAPAEALERAARSAVLRVAQEALRNIGKHAAASRAWLFTSLERDEQGSPAWLLEVGDDGRGYDPAELDQQSRRRHFGLRFMQERSELVGGQLAIETSPGRGTVVRLTIASTGGGR